MIFDIFNILKIKKIMSTYFQTKNIFKTHFLSQDQIIRCTIYKSYTLNKI
jgi:hypothetical protein